MVQRRKRKRSYSTKYRRRRYPSAYAVARKIAKMNSSAGPFGDPRSANFQKYGPSYAQMMANPGWSRTAEQSAARAADRYYGPGGYWSDAWDWTRKHFGGGIKSALVGGGEALGGLAGGLLGPEGAAAGGVIGSNIGANISRAIGTGSYRVTNDLIQNNGGNAPVYHSAGAFDEMGDVIMSNRELVTFVTAGPKPAGATKTDFKLQSFTLNPVDDVFHHLRQTARQYEQFEFLGLMFEYVPMTGEGGENELGVLGMAASYDPAQTRHFTNMEDMVRFKGSITTKPSNAMLFGIECDPQKRAIKTMYTRDSVNRGKDFTDMATFYVATQGMPNGEAQLGQLWVTYSVKLRNLKPNLLQEIVEPVRRDGVSWRTLTTAAINDSTVVRGENNNGILVDLPITTTSTVADFELAQQCQIGSVWYIQIQHQQGSGTAAHTIVPSIIEGLEFVQITGGAVSNSKVNYYAATEASGDNKGFLHFKVRVTTEAPKFRLTYGSAINDRHHNLMISEAHADDHHQDEIRTY